MCKSKQVERSLQVFLWLWFGTITSFCAVNVVNIARLETENKLIKGTITIIEKHLIENSSKN